MLVKMMMMMMLMMVIVKCAHWKISCVLSLVLVIVKFVSSIGDSSDISNISIIDNNITSFSIGYGVIILVFVVFLMIVLVIVVLMMLLIIVTMQHHVVLMTIALLMISWCNLYSSIMITLIILSDKLVINMNSVIISLVSLHHII